MQEALVKKKKKKKSKRCFYVLIIYLTKKKKKKNLDFDQFASEIFMVIEFQPKHLFVSVKAHFQY